LEKGDTFDPVGDRDWEVLIDDLMLNVFWDDDFLDAELPDVEPQHGRELKKHMGIHEEYFTAIPPAMTDEERVRLGRFLSEVKKESP
jgi:hypothetical protein